MVSAAGHRMVSARAKRLAGMVLTSHRDGAKVRRSDGARPAHRPPAGANSQRIEAAPVGGLFHDRPMSLSAASSFAASNESGVGFRPRPGPTGPFRIYERPFLPGPVVPCSARRSTPDRLSAPVRLSPTRLFSSSDRVSVPDRRSSPARRPAPDRLSSPPIVASPPVAETHTEDRNLTYSAGLCPDRRHLFRAVWPGWSSGPSRPAWRPLSSPRRQIAQYASNLAIMFQNRDLTVFA